MDFLHTMQTAKCEGFTDGHDVSDNFKENAY